MTGEHCLSYKLTFGAEYKILWHVFETWIFLEFWIGQDELPVFDTLLESEAWQVHFEHFYFVTIKFQEGGNNSFILNWVK